MSEVEAVVLVTVLALAAVFKVFLQLYDASF